ncbi:MAG TPA: hypothetical protein VMZ92_09240 [Planctomycetota bacterium]|nr:hypothetical protein [Planctomycetota bacterium]
MPDRMTAKEYLRWVGREGDDYPDGDLLVGWVVCRMCGAEHLSAIPSDSLMLDCQECPHCHNMTCEFLEGD